MTADQCYAKMIAIVDEIEAKIAPSPPVEGKEWLESKMARYAILSIQYADAKEKEGSRRL